MAEIVRAKVGVGRNGKGNGSSTDDGGFEIDMCILSGTTCLLGGSPSCGSDCSGAPMLPLLYIACNLGFNIAALNLLKTAGVFLLPARQCHMLCICTALSEGGRCEAIFSTHATNTSSVEGSQLHLWNPVMTCMALAVCCFACIASHMQSWSACKSC